MVRVLFLHPDLGIGGAERLVVDAALALQRHGHEVSFLTNHHDPTHCFKETVDGRFTVQVVGDWLPRKLFGRFYAFCAYFRMLYAAFYASFYLSRREQIDIVFCDQISVGIPVLRLAHHRPKILFYCHFPDQLLSKQEGILKSVYRAPLNYLEEYTIGMADKTFVNSKFTLRVFQDTFRRIPTVPDVLYPSLDTNYFDQMLQRLETQRKELNSDLVDNIPDNAFIFLDINRYERKKNHAIAFRAFHELSKRLPPASWQRCRLIVVGGYDAIVVENVEHYEELVELKHKLNLEKNLIQMRCLSDDEKVRLLHMADCLIYTPANEHFGIVPLEAMYMSKPVIAVNSGGPTETIVHNSTGLLCDPEIKSFTDAMWQLHQDKGLRERMGQMGRKRVEQRFSFEAFANKLDGVIQEIINKEKGPLKKHN